MGFKIEIKGAEKLIKALKGLPEKTLNEVKAEIKFGAGDIANMAGDLAPADEGLIRTSIKSEEVEKTKAKVKYQVGVYAPYAGFMEFGTGSKVDIPTGWEEQASKAKNMPSGTWAEFIDSLTDWVKRKGIAGTYSIKTKRRTGNKKTQDEQNRQLAYMIARKIYREGLKPRPFLRPAFENKQGEIIKNIENVLKDITL